MVRYRHRRRAPAGSRGIGARAGGVRDLSDTELERIRSAYRERDAAETTPYRWDNPGYVSYLQEIERALLAAFANAGVRFEGSQVLDIGCGSGYFLHRLREYGAGECHGIDLMENRIAEGRKSYPTLRFHVGSATELPFEDGEFDLVTQFTCLSSITDRDLRLVAAREMRRVAQGGWVLSFDLRGMRPGVLRRPSRSGSTPTVPLDGAELRRLFGAATLLRRVGLSFGVTERLGKHELLEAALRALPPLRSHLLGLWKIAPKQA
jgi:SAM-dependent methyltransferase